jgi:Alanyl-tRNA synthetase
VFEHNTFEVIDTTKLFGSFYLHHGKVKKGKFKIGDSVTATIDSYKRQLIKCNHSSTHLLHASLRKILGNHVSQKGSLVNSEKLRFDFSHNEPITSDNIIKIENFVKKEITANSQIEIKTIDHQKALDEGATALFGEKYGDEVRVVSMGTLEGNKIISKELCGGTHVAQTGDILNFKIINQTSVASGIRRIEALTNIAVDEYNKQKIQLDNKTLKENLDKISILISEIKEYDNNFDYSYDQNSDLTNNLKELKKLLDQKKQK